MIDKDAPAFPTDEEAVGAGCTSTHEQTIAKKHGGLTIRAYFAGLAMQGFCANRTEEELEIPKDQCHEIVAKHALKMADALIDELNKADQ